MNLSKRLGEPVDVIKAEGEEVEKEEEEEGKKRRLTPQVMTSKCSREGRWPPAATWPLVSYPGRDLEFACVCMFRQERKEKRRKKKKKIFFQFFLFSFLLKSVN